MNDKCIWRCGIWRSYKDSQINFKCREFVCIPVIDGWTDGRTWWYPVKKRYPMVLGDASGYEICMKTFNLLKATSEKSNGQKTNIWIANTHMEFINSSVQPHKTCKMHLLKKYSYDEKTLTILECPNGIYFISTFCQTSWSVRGKWHLSHHGAGWGRIDPAKNIWLFNFFRKKKHSEKFFLAKIKHQMLPNTTKTSSK